MTQEFYPGTRVLVFDPRLFKDDRSTPCSFTMRPATVLCWYGKRAPKCLGGYPYPSLVDVKFDYRDGVSHGHFTHYLEEIKLQARADAAKEG